jgi:hypothetical protein
MPLPQVNERVKEVPAQALRAVFAGIGQVLLVADKIRHRAAEQVSGGTAASAPPREAPATKPEPEPPTEPADPASARWRTLDETGNVRLVSESEATAAATASAPPVPDLGAPAPKTPSVAKTPAAKTPAGQTPAGQTPAGQAPADQTPADQTPADVALADEALAGVAPVEVAPPLTDEFPVDIQPGAAEAHPTPTASVPAAPHAPATPDAGQPGGLPLSNYDALSIASLRARLRVLNASQVSALLEYETVTQGRPDVITMFERRLAKLAQEDG